MLRLAEAALEWRRVGDEVVVLNTQTARYLALNRTGSALWESLIAGTDEAGLASELVERFGVSLEQAQSDVAVFVADLDGHGLLESEQEQVQRH